MDAERQELYQLMIRQLQADGFHKAAESIIQDAKLNVQNALPNNDLLKAVFPETPAQQHDPLEYLILQLDHNTDRDDAIQIEEKEDEREKKVFPNYATRFISASKSSLRCAAINWQGDFAATAADDCSVKILEVEKMHASVDIKTEKQGEYENARPVFRTLYDHARPVNDMAFHPTRQMLITGSSEGLIKFFEFTKQNQRRAVRFFREQADVRSIAIHPLGDYLLVGVDHPIVRLYDIASQEPYTCSDATQHHVAPITQVRYSKDARMFASGSREGTVKIWDASNFTCERNIIACHEGESINSVEFSNDGRYLLTSGQDTTARIWEVASGKEVLCFEREVKGSFRMQAMYSFDNEFVFTADETTSSIFGWDASTGQVVGELKGHSKYVRYLAPSPTENAFLSCSDDSRARFWAADD